SSEAWVDLFRPRHIDGLPELRYHDVVLHWFVGGVDAQHDIGAQQPDCFTICAMVLGIALAQELRTLNARWCSVLPCSVAPIADIKRIAGLDHRTLLNPFSLARQLRHASLHAQSLTCSEHAVNDTVVPRLTTCEIDMMEANEFR